MSDTGGLVGWWPLHDEEATDYSGNGNHGTLHGGVTTGVAGRGGLEAMGFSGGDAVSYPSQGDLFDGSNDYTVSVWVRLRRKDTGHLQRFWHPRADYDVSLQEYEGSLEWSFYDGSSYPIGTSSFSLDEWIHLVGVWDATDGERRFYKDGSLVGTDSTGTPSSQSDSNGWGGNPTNDKYYVDGVQFDGRIYNYALSESEIQTLYEWGSLDLARPPTDGVAYYPLDGDADDAWGDNDGSIVGDVSWSDDAVRGQAGEFDGSQDGISIPDSDSLSVTDGFTFSLWVKVEALGSENYRFIWKKDTYTLWCDEDPIEVRCEFQDPDGDWRGIDQDGGEPLMFEEYENEWVHLVGTYDGDVIRLYKNGALWTETDEIGRSVRQSSESVELMFRELNNNHVEGNLDDVRIYDYALEPWEVFQLYLWGTRGRDMRGALVRARS